jgi:hypothetical protein
MTQVSCKITIYAPADAIWQLIGDFGAAGQYLAGVVNCTVEGEGVGARRTLTPPTAARLSSASKRWTRWPTG